MTIGLALTTVLLPLLLPVSLVIDASRLVRGRPRVALRFVVIVWIYLFAEALGLVWMAGSWIASGLGRDEERLQGATYRTQRVWAGVMLRSLRAVFRLGLEVDGEGSLAPGPAVYMLRHASLIDTLLPSVLITSRHGIRLRYVLKVELLADPALDIAGNRIPNAFVERGVERGAGPEASARVGALATGLGPDEGVLIYPEGTRYRAARRDSILVKLAPDPAAHVLAARLRHLHPPRRGGPLALLDAGYDVVFGAHAGLDGFASVRDLWRGDQIGGSIRVSFRRVAADRIPTNPDDRYLWLLEEWLKVDESVDELVRRGGG